MKPKEQWHEDLKYGAYQVATNDIDAIQKDARSGMIELSELDKTIELLDEFLVYGYPLAPAFIQELDRLKALRNEHTS